jgi:hypothetical protein
MGAAVAAIGSVSGVLNSIEGLFTGSSYDATHQQLLTWASTIATGQGKLSNSSVADAWLRLRCWAGDQSVITAANTAELFGGGNVAQGCGCEVSHGCRADAQATVQSLKASFPSLTIGSLSSAPTQNPSAQSGSTVIGVNSQGTITAQVPTASLFLSDVPLLLGIGVVLLVAYLALRRK